MSELALDGVTYKELEAIYYGIDIDISVLFREPKNDDDYINNFLSSKLWRLNNLYTIVDKDGIKKLFNMNLMQFIIHSYTLKHPRIILLKSRQIGGSTFASLNFLDDAIFIDDLSIGLMAQGQAESATLLQRIKLAWEEFPQVIKDFLGLRLIKDNHTEYAFNNGSTIFIRTSFRSATLHRLWISEFAKISVKYPERAVETTLGTLQAIKPGNPVLIESTAERGGEYQRLWDLAYNFVGQRSAKDFKPLFIGWTNDPSCQLNVPQEINKNMAEYFKDIEIKLDIKLTNEQKWFYVSAARELGEAVTQEYPSTPEEAFAGSRDGSYYAKLIRENIIQRKRIVKDLWDPSLPVYAMFDLGINDDFIIIWFQVFAKEVRIIDNYANSGEGLAHYVEVMSEKDYDMATTYLPHDADNKELGTGISRRARLRELGLRRTKVLKKSPISTGIEQVRKMIPYLWVDAKCTDWLEAMQNYSKEWDSKNGVWKDKPNHNKWSHYADGSRGIAMSGIIRLHLGLLKEVEKEKKVKSNGWKRLRRKKTRDFSV